MSLRNKVPYHFFNLISIFQRFTVVVTGLIRLACLQVRVAVCQCLSNSFPDVILADAILTGLIMLAVV